MSRDLAAVYSFFRQGDGSVQEPGPSGAGAQGDRGDAPRPASAPPRSSPAPVYAGMRRAALVDPAAGFDAATGGRDLRQAGWQEMGGAVLVKPPPARALASAIEASSSSGTARDVAYALSNDNVGFRLLKQAGWSEGQGLGLRGAGIAVPLAPLANAGRRGLGVRGAVRAVEPGAAGGDKGYWQLREEQKRLIVAQLGPGALEPANAGEAGSAGRAPSRPGLGSAALERAAAAMPEESEEQRSKRMRQVQEQENADARGRAIQTALYRAFKDEDTQKPENNPLRRRTKLTLTNPLLP